jgi:diguanylate cyclase (GGDEF)-like protein
MKEKGCREFGEYKALEHVLELINSPVVPPLDEELQAIPALKTIHRELAAIREIVYDFSSGDLSSPINIRGYISGCLKALQSRFQHLIWQVQMVEQGDFSQKVQFLGEFSVAFNHMTSRLDATLRGLKEKENSLTTLTENLRREVERRTSAVEALQRSESQFKYLASHDPLTGAMNRRSFMERAVMELESAILLNISCGVVMMDIDHFKDFNDTYGHLAGDEALRHVVKTISSLLRKNDFLGRYGGEEFIFFFTNADKKTGINIAERIRETLGKTPVTLENGPVTITASFGVAMAVVAEIGDHYIELLINHADSALYEAKNTGRNRVAAYDPPEESPGPEKP